MTSRQRVLAAVNHVQPDRAPVDFGGHRSSGIMAIAYRRLRQHLGLPQRLPRVYDMIQQLAIIDEDVLDRFGIDIVELGRTEVVFSDTPCNRKTYEYVNGCFG